MGGGGTAEAWQPIGVGAMRKLGTLELELGPRALQSWSLDTPGAVGPALRAQTWPLTCGLERGCL